MATAATNLQRSQEPPVQISAPMSREDVRAHEAMHYQEDAHRMEYYQHEMAPQTQRAVQAGHGHMPTGRALAPQMMQAAMQERHLEPRHHSTRHPRHPEGRPGLNAPRHNQQHQQQQQPHDPNVSALPLPANMAPEMRRSFERRRGGKTGGDEPTWRPSTFLAALGKVGVSPKKDESSPSDETH
eukprot:NODE_3024_length_992_cov_35.042418_g2525_i0.p2 GENE.NODE_3024_length_992_cov_35.042418_g2525_i0~~NODE_3024_length_992_cov_35.042418_g2525_i0.p2  ORF type:complete len:184 (-),score=32.87 NODE_3024_length_992_cov_35.042418_g2525_i0:204-755(-)